MNLLIISQSKNIVGGANRSLLDVIELLSSKYGHKCTIITPGQGQFAEILTSKGYKVLFQEYHQNTFTILHDIFDVYRFSKATFIDIKNRIAAKATAKEIVRRSLKFDCVYINDTSNTYGFYLSNYLDLPYVWHFRNYNSNVKRYMLFEKKLRQGTNGICIAISNVMRKYMTTDRRISENSILTIHNGVSNHNNNVHFPWHDRVNENTYHCLHCGMLMEIKDQITSIKSIAILKNKGYSVYLHLAGPTTYERGEPYQRKLERLVLDLNVVDNVRFEGNIDNMSRFRKDMAFELMCSKAEPFGRVTVEGMQSGLVVIGANTGATPEIIQDGKNGLIFEQGVPEDLASKIEYIIKNPDAGNRIARQGYEFSKDHFTMEENVNRINEVIEMVITKN